MSPAQALALRPGGWVYAVWPVATGWAMQKRIVAGRRQSYDRPELLFEGESAGNSHNPNGWEATPADAWRAFLHRQRAGLRAAELAAVQAGVIPATTADALTAAAAALADVADDQTVPGPVRATAEAVLKSVKTVETP